MPPRGNTANATADVVVFSTLVWAEESAPADMVAIRAVFALATTISAD